MALNVGDICKTVEPGMYGDWKSAGRRCEVISVHNGPVIVHFDDGNGWHGYGYEDGCWVVSESALILLSPASKDSYEMDA